MNIKAIGLTGLRSIVAAPILLLGLSTNSTATTGAELLELDKTLATGYVRGAVDYMLADYTSYDETRNRLTAHRDKCLGSMDANALYQAIVRQIQEEPSFLRLEATEALKNMAFKMCGPPS